MRILSVSLLISAQFILGACATIPSYTPAEICSSEWIAPRANSAMSDFKHDTKSIFKKLKKAGNSVAHGNKPGPLQMFSLMSSLKKLGNQFENGQAMKAMRTLASTCNDPNLIKNAMTDLLRENGIEEKFISFLNSFDAYTELLRTGKKPDIKL